MDTTESCDAGALYVDLILEQARQITLRNYCELLRVGNPPGANTAEIAFIVYMAKSLSTLPKAQLDHLRSQGILTF